MKTTPFHAAARVGLALAFLGSIPAEAAVSSITSNFNGTNIPDPSDIWFNSHISSVSGVSTPYTIFVQDQTIQFKSPLSGVTYTLNVPDAVIHVDPTAGGASTSYSALNDLWTTTVTSAAGNPFMSGLAWDVP